MGWPVRQSGYVWDNLDVPWIVRKISKLMYWLQEAEKR